MTAEENRNAQLNTRAAGQRIERLPPHREGQKRIARFGIARDIRSRVGEAGQRPEPDRLAGGEPARPKRSTIAVGMGFAADRVDDARSIEAMWGTELFRNATPGADGIKSE